MLTFTIHIDQRFFLAQIVKATVVNQPTPITLFHTSGVTIVISALQDHKPTLLLYPQPPWVIMLEKWYEFGRIDWVGELEYPEWTVKEVGRFLNY